MKTIAIVNLKGGVGKTVTAINLAAILATEYEKRVLLIDADAQGNATESLLPEGEYNTLSALLCGHEPYYENLIYPSAVRNVDVLPADSGLMDADLASIRGGGCNVDALRDLRDTLIEDDAYDFVLLDCPPSFSAACVAAIAASDSILIPVKPDRYSLSGMEELTTQIDRVRKIHPDVRIAGCLVTMWYNCDAMRQGEVQLRRLAPVHVYETVIRRTAKVDESTWMCEPVISWSPRSAAAQDYRRFAAEFLAREGVLARG